MRRLVAVLVILSAYSLSLHSQQKTNTSAFADAGQLQAGDRFPPVRVLSQELKINPNTAQKVLTTLVERGLVEVHPGIGTTVAALASCR